MTRRGLRGGKGSKLLPMSRLCSQVEGLGVITRDWQTLLPQERQLVPVTALEHDLVSDDMEEATSAKPQRIPPLKDGPFTIFEDLLDEALHLGRRKTCRK